MTSIQIFGSRKSRDTQKAERFFKERGIKYQFIDLAEKGMSKGELDSVKSVIPLEKLLDRGSGEFKRQNLAFMEFDIAEKLLEHPLLMKMPVVRCGKAAACGFDPAELGRIAKAAE
ncbi:MAG: ArsC/Spx/MgsR family protein [Brevinematales bacterium]|jgi:arsenate reductase-like glutaredoxin family protein